jgi:hypothetical protein
VGNRGVSRNNFKLEEEEGTALLLHLPLLIAETAVFSSASQMRCRLVVATVQATDSALCNAANNY